MFKSLRRIANALERIAAHHEREQAYNWSESSKVNALMRIATALDAQPSTMATSDCGPVVDLRDTLIGQLHAIRALLEEERLVKK